jgi:transcription initiation factor TFIID TATA-box-binding protein
MPPPVVDSTSTSPRSTRCLPVDSLLCKRARDGLTAAIQREAVYTRLFVAAAAAARAGNDKKKTSVPSPSSIVASKVSAKLVASGSTERIDAIRSLGTASQQVASLCAQHRDLLEERTRVERLRFEVASVLPADKNAEEEEAVSLGRASRFTDSLGLGAYAGMLRYVPKLVNVVTLVRVEPIAGSGTVLPLPLERIARRCAGAFFSPRRFAAVQLAFRSPRCRILVFHTGKLVGTGCSSITEARLAIIYACEKMAREAGVYVRIATFDVMNTVGATAMNTTIDCSAFAKAHSSEAMFDKSSFVGLTWRPRGEPICVEVYGTGRANLPGACTYTALLCSFSTLVSELLRFSSSSIGCVAADDPLKHDSGGGHGGDAYSLAVYEPIDLRMEEGAADGGLRLTERQRQRQTGIVQNEYTQLGLSVGRRSKALLSSDVVNHDDEDGGEEGAQGSCSRDPIGTVDDAWFGWTSPPSRMC